MNGLRGLICLAVDAGVLFGPAVIAALLARWSWSPSREERRPGFPVVPLPREEEKRGQ